MSLRILVKYDQHLRVLNIQFTQLTFSMKKEILKANPTVRGIQQCSKQSFQPHHPGVSETPPPRFFLFFFANLLGKCYISVEKKGLFTHNVELLSLLLIPAVLRLSKSSFHEHDYICVRVCLARHCYGVSPSNTLSVMSSLRMSPTMILRASALFPRLQYAIHPTRSSRECSEDPRCLPAELELLRESREESNVGFECV
jgi:hypothetical protein